MESNCQTSPSTSNHFTTLPQQPVRSNSMTEAQTNVESCNTADESDNRSLIVRESTSNAGIVPSIYPKVLLTYRNPNVSLHGETKSSSSNVNIRRAPPGMLFGAMKKSTYFQPVRSNSIVTKLTTVSVDQLNDHHGSQLRHPSEAKLLPRKEYSLQRKSTQLLLQQLKATAPLPTEDKLNEQGANHPTCWQLEDNSQQENQIVPVLAVVPTSCWQLPGQALVPQSSMKEARLIKHTSTASFSQESTLTRRPIHWQLEDATAATCTQETSMIVWSSSTPPVQQEQSEAQLMHWQPIQQDDSVPQPERKEVSEEFIKQTPDIDYGVDGSLSKQSTHSSIGKNSSHGSTCSTSDLESQDDDATYKAPCGNEMLIHVYFKTWTIATIVMLLINCANMDWVYLFKNESWWMICASLFFFGIQGILQWSVLELPLMSFASAFVKADIDRVADGRHLTLLINYNLLASYKSEVDATLVNAFSAYIGNLGPTIACVLVSATGDQELKDYELLVRDNLREQIFELVISEGKAWASGKILDEGRATRIFEPFRDRMGIIDENFVQLILPSIASKYAKDFMVVQRVTRVLRKCGQYQDLMLLSEGDNSAWTYTDKLHYKEAAREYGEPLFHISEDVENIQGRRFDYTLVLDSDTGVIKNTLSTLLDVAAANPERAIVQPAIKIYAKEDQSLFMHIDKMRQEINEPITAALTTLLGRSGFYGKGLIQNKYYIKALLGTRDHPIEKVPIDVLSHDTFEAGALSPLYVSCVQLLEEPCGNYVTWDIRECRWNRGELLLAHYFFPRSLGRLFEWMMCRTRKTPPTKLILRYETHLDEAGAYIAHSALRQMMLKPLLLLYIICRVWVRVYLFFNWLPLVLMVLLVLILPKIPLTNRRNWHKVLADILCCVLQYSPEPITGTIRVLKSAQAHITGVSGWVPQFKVEQDFLIQPAVVATFAYQWRLLLLTCASLAPIIIFRPEDYLLIFLFGVTAFIPIYTTLTALPYSSWKRSIQRIKLYVCCEFIKKQQDHRRGRFLRNQKQQLQQRRSQHSRRSANLQSRRRSDSDDNISVLSNASSRSNKSFY